MRIIAESFALSASFRIFAPYNQWAYPPDSSPASGIWERNYRDCGAKALQKVEKQEILCAF